MVHWWKELVRGRAESSFRKAEEALFCTLVGEKGKAQLMASKTAYLVVSGRKNSGFTEAACCVKRSQGGGGRGSEVESKRR